MKKAGGWQVLWYQRDGRGRDQETEQAHYDLSTNIQASEGFAVPAPDGLAYRPFQLAGIEFIKRRYEARKPGTLLADDPGLGKTIQAIGTINALGLDRVLIVCPASVKANWAIELDRWLYDGPPVKTVPRDALRPGRGIYIINYDILKKFHRELRAEAWDMVVLDESHMVNNMDTARYKALFGRTQGALIVRHWLLMTGTPLLNKPADLFVACKTCEPAAFGNNFLFKQRYNGATVGHYGMQMGQPTNQAELAGLLKRFMVRREKEAVLTELPPKRWQIVELPPLGELAMKLDRERRMWVPDEKAMERVAQAVLAAPKNASMDDLAKQVGSLKRGAAVQFDEMARARSELAEAKMPLVAAHVEALLEDGEHEKVVVMAHHKSMILGLFKRLGHYNPVMLHGSMAKPERQRSVERFQSDRRCQVFIGSIRAAGVGITLTAARALVFAEQDWVSGWMEQAANRTHRIGSTGQVDIQVLVVEGSLDARMAKVVDQKRTAEQQIVKRKIAGAIKDEGKVVPAAGTLIAMTAEDIRLEEALKPCKHQFDEVEAALGLRAMRYLVQLGGSSHGVDGRGLSKVHRPWGKALANLNTPSDGQVLEMMRLAYRYRGQMPSSLLAPLKVVWDRLAS